jgi:hypothetical protein
MYLYIICYHGRYVHMPLSKRNGPAEVTPSSKFYSLRDVRFFRIISGTVSSFKDSPAFPSQ